jgi:RNA-directed DNA polymerase
VSPVLANLFMHYAFDKWLEREFPMAEFRTFRKVRKWWKG